MSVLRPEYLPIDRVPAEGVVAAIAFGTPAPKTRGLGISIPLPQVGPPLVEVWRAAGAVTRERYGSVDTARNGDVLFGAIRLDVGPADEAASVAYDALVQTCRVAGYPNLWRIWNHVGGINEDDEGLERYKRFSMGRHEAMTRHGYARERFPAASAVGMSEPGLMIYFVAGRMEGRQIENPRQVSAYDYPRQYGPRSPSFSRATVVGDDLIFISGTASVVGHESHHTGSAERQLQETIQNLDVTLGAAAELIGRKATTRDLTVAKIYLRGGTADEGLLARLREEFPSSLLLESDICRRELMLEIEGVAVLAAGS